MYAKLVKAISDLEKDLTNANLKIKSLEESKNKEIEKINLKYDSKVKELNLHVKDITENLKEKNRIKSQMDKLNDMVLKNLNGEKTEEKDGE